MAQFYEANQSWHNFIKAE